MGLMCFGKKPDSPPPMSISSPYAIVHEKIIFNADHQIFSPPHQDFRQKYTLNPITPSSWHSAETLTSPKTSSATSPSSATTKRWLKISKNTRRVFQNAGLDEHGRLKLEYEDLEEPDWGVPDDWRKQWRGRGK